MATSSKNRSTWSRLRRNTGARIGMVVIAISIIVAVFGYFIAPDNSPYANRMIVEIGGQKPGYKQLVLKTKRDSYREVSFFNKMLFGSPEKWDYLPIETSVRMGDSLIVGQYIDEGVTERKAIYLDDASNENLQTDILTFRWGTDKYGRDIYSRLLIGVRVSLGVGLITVIISLSIGVLLGALAGYFRGWVDEVIMWFINVIWSIPTLLLVFAITLVLGKGFWQIFIAIGLTMWVSVARIIRGQVLSVREMEYVEAARALGYGNLRIITKHVLPNVMGPVMVVAASNFASAIVIEAGLSFLGVGVQPPQPSWGLMIKENYNFIITNNPMLALAPGFAIMILVLAFNMLGSGLRDALQVKE